jgi:cytochrome oxidase Cu insertion factor (SCO1/SenC/PrrC family)
MFRRMLPGLLLVGCVASGCTSSRAERLSRRMKNRPAPNFELKDLDGGTVRLADFRGKPVVLAFFAFG